MPAWKAALAIVNRRGGNALAGIERADVSCYYLRHEKHRGSNSAFAVWRGGLRLQSAPARFHRVCAVFRPIEGVSIPRHSVDIEGVIAEHGAVGPAAPPGDEQHLHVEPRAHIDGI